MMTTAGLPIVQLVWEQQWGMPGEGDGGIPGRTIVHARERNGVSRQFFIPGALDDELVRIIYRSAPGCAKLPVFETEATITESSMRATRPRVILYRVSGGWLLPYAITGGRFGNRRFQRSIADIARAQGVSLE